MRAPLDLPDPLFLELKARAARQGVKMNELLVASIEERLRSGKGARGQASPGRRAMAIARRAMGATIPALDNSQIAEILDAEDVYAGH
jgi:hypothetical protein